MIIQIFPKTPQKTKLPATNSMATRDMELPIRQHSNTPQTSWQRERRRNEPNMETLRRSCQPPSPAAGRYNVRAAIDW